MYSLAKISSNGDELGADNVWILIHFMIMLLLLQIWGNAVGGHHRCVFCSADFSSPQIVEYAHCMGQQEKTLAALIQAHKEGNSEEMGSFFLPGILLGDVETTLQARGLEGYAPGHDRLHNCKGHLSALFGLLQHEPHFDSVLAQRILYDELHRRSFIEDMKGSDWRRWFANYRVTMLPCMQHELEEAEMIFRTWMDIQHICYQGECRG